MFDYLEKMRAKPGHIRERIALATAAGTTLLVAAGWLAVMTSTHAFSANPDQYASADTSGADASFGAAAADTKSSFSNLLGAVGITTSGDTAPAGIVVETEASTSVDQPAPTVIPF